MTKWTGWAVRGVLLLLRADPTDPALGREDNAYISGPSGNHSSGPRPAPVCPKACGAWLGALTLTPPQSQTHSGASVNTAGCSDARGAASPTSHVDTKIAVAPRHLNEPTAEDYRVARAVLSRASRGVSVTVPTVGA